jgi:hypothetical protein
MDGKKFMKIMSLLLSVVMLTFSVQAEAKRLGGGRSFGKQSGSVTQREAIRPARQNAATPSSAAPAVQQARRPWGAMLGGLAAGLGLAWLAHSMGLGAEFGQFLMFGLLALGLMLLVGWFMRRRVSTQTASPYAYGGAGSAGGNATGAVAGNGGAGVVSSISGSPIQYAGGGAGGLDGTGALPLGGAGGGNGGIKSGAGAVNPPATTGLANTGGGGGGSTQGVGAAGGGSGIVILRYPSYLAPATSTTGSPTYYQAVGYNVYVFNSSGTITF